MLRNGHIRLGSQPNHSRALRFLLIDPNCQTMEIGVKSLMVHRTSGSFPPIVRRLREEEEEARDKEEHRRSHFHDASAPGIR